MSKPEEEYTCSQKHSLETLRTAAASTGRSGRSRMGSLHPPLLNIPLDRVVLDELHLLLRIFDVLLRN